MTPTVMGLVGMVFSGGTDRSVMDWDCYSTNWGTSCCIRKCHLWDECRRTNRNAKPYKKLKDTPKRYKHEKWEDKWE